MIITKKFDKMSSQWENNEKYNELYLSTQHLYFNQIFKVKGFVFLRDIYNALGLQTTMESCIWGWYRDVDADKGVDFKFSRIEDSDDFEIIFDCYPIIEYLKRED